AERPAGAGRLSRAWAGGDAGKRRVGRDLPSASDPAAAVRNPQSLVGLEARARWARRRLIATASMLGVGAGADFAGGSRGRVPADGWVPSHQLGNSPIQCSGFTCFLAAILASA